MKDYFFKVIAVLYFVFLTKEKKNSSGDGKGTIL